MWAAKITARAHSLTIFDKFNHALDEAHGRGVGTEARPECVDVRARHFELLLGHIDARHGAALANERRREVAVATAAASEVQNVESLD
mgnify:CR=1 FL=1